MRYIDRMHLTQYRLGQYMTSPAVARQMAKLVTTAEPWRILDPACGSGNLLIAAVLEARERGIQVESVIGVEIDAGLAREAQERLGALGLDCPTGIVEADFFDVGSREVRNANVILANPPYGSDREYAFFRRCDSLMTEAELIFLVPLAFLDRFSGTRTSPLSGRPLRVTTGNAIVSHRTGEAFSFKPVKPAKRHAIDIAPFAVLTGLKVYERGAGTPPQTADVISQRLFTADEPRPGWLMCVRTGDILPTGVGAPRLWVDYGEHLAHPKEFSRFDGPRLIVRRVPLWEGRRLCCLYVDYPLLATGDLLIVQHVDNDAKALQGLAEYINSDEATSLMHKHRPTVALRDSFPKISAKDLSWLIAQHQSVR